MKICTNINDLKKFQFRRNEDTYEIVGSYPGYVILMNIRDKDLHCVDILDLNVQYKRI